MRENDVGTTNTITYSLEIFMLGSVFFQHQYDPKFKWNFENTEIRSLKDVQLSENQNLLWKIGAQNQEKIC